MATLEFRSLEKSFGATKVIENIDLKIDDGEFVVFVGPSGCGKSTLLRLISGLDRATSGSILIDDTDVSNTHPSKRGVAMVFQSYALYPHMTVAGNIGFASRKAGGSKRDVAQKVQTAARILGIGDLLDRRPGELSGGQRQRVAIGRAIVREPRIFLFDEPLSNLDSELRVQMRLEIARLHRDLGITMIFVTHDQVEAMTLADRIVILRAGRIEQSGSPLEIFDDPGNMFVAGFVGSPKMNFLAADPIGTETGKLTVKLSDFDDAMVDLALAAPDLHRQRPLVLGIRPDCFDRDAPGRMEVTVDAIENLGNSAFAYASGRTGTLLTVDLKGDRVVRPNTKMQIGFDPARVFLFDAETGERLR